MALNEVRSGDAYLMVWMRLGAGILTAVLLALAASGIYAIMSFAVAERTREIGIRAALGAQRSNIVSTVAMRSIAQIGVGVLVGIPIAGGLLAFLKRELGSTSSPFVIALVLGVSVMVLIGMLACTAPTLRALRIMPTEARREGG